MEKAAPMIDEWIVQPNICLLAQGMGTGAFSAGWSPKARLPALSPQMLS